MAFAAPDLHWRRTRANSASSVHVVGMGPSIAGLSVGFDGPYPTKFGNISPTGLGVGKGLDDTFPELYDNEVDVERSSFRWPRNPPGPWFIELEWAPVEGRAEVVTFTVGSVGRKQPVTASDLREIPFATIVREDRAKKVARLRKMAGDTRTVADLRRDYQSILRAAGEAPQGPQPDDPGGDRRLSDGATERAALYEKAGGRGGRPKQYDDAHWAEVATTYTRAFNAGNTPTTAVARKWSVNPSTAGKWVAKCRALGLLVPTTQGRPGGVR